jgi:hypothetical protein
VLPKCKLYFPYFHNFPKIPTQNPHATMLICYQVTVLTPSPNTNAYQAIKDHNMSTSAQLAANIANAQLSSGPRTETGRATCSKNATTHGLFTQTDFIRPGEEQDYAQAKADLAIALAPAGPLETSLVDEIHRAIWRLRRCGQVEATFLETLGQQKIDASGTPDPMQSETTAKLQLSVDRARSQSHRLLHKCTAELRRLQTDRHFLNHAFEAKNAFEAGADLSALGLSDYRAIQKGLNQQVAARLRKRHLDEAEQFDEMTAVTTEQANQLLTIQTQSPPREAMPEAAPIARNAPCPCQSGEKYKRCCGKNASPLLHAA